MAPDRSDFCMLNQDYTQGLLSGDIKIDLESKVKVKQEVTSHDQFLKCHNFETVRDRRIVCMRHEKETIYGLSIGDGTFDLE